MYCSLARYHAKAGRPDLAEKTYQDQVRPLVAYLEAKRTDPPHAMNAEYSMCQLVHGALRRRTCAPRRWPSPGAAAKFTTDYAAFPLRYPELDYSIAVCAWELARGLRDLGDAAAALQQADHARRLWADYWQARPNAHTGGIQLAHAWVEVGKSQLALGRSDEAWTAFQEAVSVQRRVLDRSPAGGVSPHLPGLAATICSWIAASAAVTGPAPPPRCTNAKNSGPTIPTG